MGALSSDALLAGPRGRRLCLAVAHRLHEPVWSSLFHAARSPFDPGLRQDLADQLGEVDIAALSTWQEPTRLVPAVADSVDRAIYWQEPDEEDMVAATSEITHALQPIATAIASSPSAAWWTEPADLAHLRYTDRYDPSHHDEPAQPPLLAGASEKLTSWRRNADRGSGHWWSGPLGHGLPRTTRPLTGLGSTALVWEEDTVGHSSARVWHLHTTSAPRVYEIDSAAAWTRLAATYPLDVTRSTGEGWGQVTGLDGPWLIPDFRAVADDFDAVHLTVAGYLEAATHALPLPQQAFTLLGGWDPDTTWWLTDALELAQTEPDTWHGNPDNNLTTWNHA